MKRLISVFVVLVLAGGLVAGLAAGRAAAVPKHRSATVTGSVGICGGPAPGRCRTERVGFCQQPQGCVTTDRVRALNRQGQRVATRKLRGARFTLHLAPGRYTIELLGDGKHVHGKVMQSKKIRARAHHTTVVRFVFNVP